MEPDELLETWKSLFSHHGCRLRTGREETSAEFKDSAEALMTLNLLNECFSQIGASVKFLIHEKDHEDFYTRKAVGKLSETLEEEVRFTDDGNHFTFTFLGVVRRSGHCAGNAREIVRWIQARIEELHC